MALSPEERAYVIDTATDLLRHRRRARLLRILAERIERGDYAVERERDLDGVAWSVARAIDEELADEAPLDEAGGRHEHGGDGPRAEAPCPERPQDHAPGDAPRGEKP